jgi:DNA-binding CsgD family transcriptional regulator
VSLVDTQADNQLDKEGIALAVFVSDPERPSSFSDSYMQQAYALTPTECSIMKALLKNKNIGDIAEMRGTTLETARSQLKLILQKTGTHSQVELARLLIALDSDV